MLDFIWKSFLQVTKLRRSITAFGAPISTLGEQALSGLMRIRLRKQDFYLVVSLSLNSLVIERVLVSIMTVVITLLRNMVTYLPNLICRGSLVPCFRVALHLYCLIWFRNLIRDVRIEIICRAIQVTSCRHVGEFSF